MSIRTAAFWSMGSQYIAFIIQFAVSVIISRFFLAPAEMGLFSIALASAMMVSIMQDFGISRYLMGHAELTPSAIRTASSVSFLFGLIVAAIVVGVAYPASLFYGEPRLLGLLVTIGASYLLAPFSIVPVALLSRAMNFRAIFIVNLSGVITNGVVGLSLAYSGFSTESLAWAMVAQAIVRASAAQILAPARIPFPLQLKVLHQIH